MSRRARRWAGAAAVLVVVILSLWQTQEAFSLQSLHHRIDPLQAWRNARPYTAGCALFLLYVGVTALSLPGATVLSLAAGALFGVAGGTVLASFASTVGATAAFCASRWLFRDWVAARHAARLAQINEGLRREGVLYLLSLRLIPLVPYVVVNLVMGLTSLRTWTFYWVSQLGMLAATALYVNAGTRLSRLQAWSDVASPQIIASLAALGMLPLLASWTLTRRRVRGHPGSVGRDRLP